MRAARLRIASVLAAACAIGAPAMPAHGADRTFVALEYDVAQDSPPCPGVEEFRAGVRRQLSHDPFRSSADRRVSVRIFRQAERWNGWIQWTDTQGKWVGERRISSANTTCERVAVDVGFALALQIQLLDALEPEAAPEGAGDGPSGGEGQSTEPREAPAPASAKEDEALATAPARRRMPLRLSAGLGPALVLGMAPEPVAVGRVFASARLHQFSLEVGADASLPAHHDTGGGAGVTMQRIALSAGACGHIELLAACAIAAVGRIEAQGTGVDRPASPSGTFSQVGLRVAGAVDLGGPFFATARAEGLVLLAPWSVTLDGVEVWTTPRVGGALGADIGVHIF